MSPKPSMSSEKRPLSVVKVNPSAADAQKPNSSVLSENKPLSSAKGNLADAQKPSSDKRPLSGVKVNPSASGAQKLNSATSKPSSAKKKVSPANSSKIASEPIESQSGNDSSKGKVVVPENAYAADWEDVKALMEEVN